MTDLENIIVNKFAEICDKIDELIVHAEDKQLIGVMMNMTTHSFINVFASVTAKGDHNQNVQTVTTSKGNICPIVIDDTMPLFSMKICVVQPVDLVS